MKTTYLLVPMMGILFATTSCAPADEPEAAADAAEAVTSAAVSPDDPLTGTWTGDWGPSADHRNAVTVELAWDGSTLTGTVNPGPDAIELSEASFDPATQTVTMAASATNFRGQQVNYSIEGQLDGNAMSGSWNHEGGAGDFTITR